DHGSTSPLGRITVIRWRFLTCPGGNDDLWPAAYWRRGQHHWEKDQMFKEGDLRRRAFLRLAATGVAAMQFGLMGTARAQSDQSTPDEEGEFAAAAAPTLPDYAPVPPSALGPVLNDRGYFVGRVERNLYWVTDGTYQAAFLTTREGVVLFDAPASIGRNLQRAVDEIAAANGVSNKVTHLVYPHHQP